jgi:hypothetical protein
MRYKTGKTTSAHNELWRDIKNFAIKHGRPDGNLADQLRVAFVWV